jgi:hypothetical protein
MDNNHKFNIANHPIKTYIDDKLKSNGGNGDGTDMEARVAKLEANMIEVRDRLIRVETKLDTFSTKEDLHKELHSMTWRIFGYASLLTAAVYFIAKYVH